MTKQPNTRETNIGTLLLLAIAAYAAITTPGYEIPFAAGVGALVLVKNIYYRQELRRRIPKSVRQAIAIAGIVAIIGPMVSYGGLIPIETANIVGVFAKYVSWAFLAFTLISLILSLYWPDHPDDDDQDKGRPAKEEKTTDQRSLPVDRAPATR